MKEKYLKAQNAWTDLVGLKVGDLVKINRGASTHELGWDHHWVIGMEKAIGQEVTVKSIYKGAGIQLTFMNGSHTDSACFPFFILDKVTPKLPDNIEISSEYSVQFNEDKSIEVGCQKIPFTLLEKIPFTLLEKIYKTAKSVRS